MSDGPRIRLRLYKIAPHLGPVEVSGGNPVATSPDCSCLITATGVRPLYDIALWAKHAKLAEHR